MRTIFFAAAALAATGALGCSQADDSDAGDGGTEPAWKLRALTYNTALAPDFELFTEERKPAIEAALADAAKDLDVLCVQEYWNGADFDDLATAVSGELPHVMRQSPKPGSGACSAEDLGNLGGCLATSCADFEGIGLVGCAEIACAEPIQSIDGGCLGCFLDHIEDGEFGACQGSAPKDPALFGGAFDIGLLSRYPIVKEDVLEFDAYFVRASALHAQLDVPGLGLVDTFCTHLGSPLGVIPYQGTHDTWEEEHLEQVTELTQFIYTTTDTEAALLVLGDLNMGPASDGPPPVSAELPDQYDQLVGSGFHSAVTDPACTLCADNVLHGADSAEEWIDHALLSTVPGRAKTERVMRETFPLSTPDGDVPMNLSDHYGLRVELTPE